MEKELKQFSQNSEIAQLCVSSDVLATYTTIRYEDVAHIQSFRLERLNDNTPLAVLRGSEVSALISDLYIYIDDLIAGREDNARGRKCIEPVKYRDIYIELNLRNTYDFSIGIFIDVLDICLLCKELDGSLYIYNGIFFEKFYSENIVSYLKVHYRLTFQDLLEGLRKTEEKITSDILEAGINYLKRYGFISYNDLLKKYSLTARGYMFY